MRAMEASGRAAAVCLRVEKVLVMCLSAIK